MARTLDETAPDDFRDPAIGALYAAHRHQIIELIPHVRERCAIVESRTQLFHLDYHPMNILMRDRKVVAILDFEWFGSAFELAGLGFSAFKFIRQTMVDPTMHAIESRQPTLVRRWNEAWKQAGRDGYRSTDLGLGARYRILFLIRKILGCMRSGDGKYTYDLGKQMVSLLEAEQIFGPLI